MMATRIGGQWRLVAALLAVAFFAPPGASAAEATAHEAVSSDSRAVERFRTAAALQNRELDDLAAAEWAALLEQFPDHPLAGKARFYRGLCLVRLKRAAEAERELARVVADHPDLDPDLLEQAYASLGFAQYRRAAAADDDAQAEAFDAAIATLGELVQRFPDGRFAPQAHFYRAEACRVRDDLPAAAESYQALVTGWPQHPLRAAALWGLGVTLQSLQRADEAHSPFDQFLAEFPEHDLAADVHFRRAAIRHELGHYEEALADATAFLAAPPVEPTESDRPTGSPALRTERADALLLRGLCQAKLDRPQDAVRTFHTLLEDHPEHPAADRALYELAWAYDALGDGDQAASTYRRLAMEHPNSPLAAEGCFRVGLWQLERKDFAGAARSFAGAGDRADDRDLREKAAHQLGWAHFRLEQFAEAEQAFADQLADSPDGPLSADARLMIAEARFARRDFAAALDAYTAALDAEETQSHSATGPLRELALLHAAQSAMQLSDWSQAIALLDRCEKQFPETRWRPQIHFERGRALYHQQQYAAARRQFDAAAAAGDAVLQARARFMIGEAHFARQEFDDAVRAFFQVAYAPGPAEGDLAHWRAESLFEAARCLEQTERFDSAGKLYRELVEQYPLSPKARHARVALDELNVKQR